MAVIDVGMAQMGFEGGAVTTVVELDVLGTRDVPTEDGPVAEPFGNYNAARVECTPGLTGYIYAWISRAGDPENRQLFELLAEPEPLEGRSGTLNRFVFSPPLTEAQTLKIQFNMTWVPALRHPNKASAKTKMNAPRSCTPSERRAWEAAAAVAALPARILGPTKNNTKAKR